MAGGVDQDGHRYHFTVLGFPVHVGWQFFIWPVLAGLDWRTPLQLVEWVAVVFASVLIHEVGHALAYRRFGSPARISLWGLGGLTFGRVPHRRWQDIAISLAGPIPPLVLVGLPAYFAYEAGVADESLFWSQTLFDIWIANLFWSIVNLLPVLPLDGGRVVDKWWGRKPARIASIVCGLLVAVVVFVRWNETTLAILALILAGINAYAFSKERSLDLTGAVGYMEAPGGMQYGGGYYEQPLDDRPKRRRGRQKRQKKRHLQPVRSAPDPRELEAWVALEQDQPAKADKIVKKLMPGVSPILIGAVLARQGNSAGAVAAYATGILQGDAVPAVGDQILAEAGLAGQVADWITSSDPARSDAILGRLVARLEGAGHVQAAADVGEHRSGFG